MRKVVTVTALFFVLDDGPLGIVHAACPAPAGQTLYRVEQVYDGDSLRLSDGTRVRLAGINTPELRHGEGPDEPFAVRAREHLSRLVADSNHRLRLKPSAESRDRYGRLLAHTYNAAGISLQEQILLAGLGVTHVHPPNLANRECYRKAETQAREQGRGVWKNLPVNAPTLDTSDKGFVVLHGRVARVRNTSRSLWLALQAGPSLRIARGDLAYFDRLELDDLAGKNIEARGWLYRHRNRLQMRIRHPDALRIAD
jgi:endonuclease YncB( thermonuclease family)